MRGRKPKPIDPGAPPAAAQFGRKLRERRIERGLTQTTLSELAGCTAQHISGLELTKAHPTKPCVAALDAALEAGGALLALVDAVVCERARANTDRQAARRLEAEALAALRCVLHSDVGDDDVEPTTRLGLLEAGAATALGVPVLGVVPARASEVDPALVDHWDNLLNALGRLAAATGPHETLRVVGCEIDLIAQHRAAARGELRMDLMRVEARWCEFAAWLSNDAGRSRDRTAWIDRAARLAAEAGCPDIVALASVRRSQWAEQGDDDERAAAHAREALSVRGVSPQTRALCEMRGANTLALAGDITTWERHVAAAYALDADAAAPAGWGWGNRRTAVLIGATEARCWMVSEPRRAIATYERVLRDWPRECVRSRGLHQARLALACAKVGELDRARAEGRKAFAIAKQTRSSSVAREVRRLRLALNTA